LTDLITQLPLALELKPHASFESLVAGPNEAAITHVRQVASGARRESVWIFGARNTGKSHLLAAACRAASAGNLRPIYLPLDPAGDPGMLCQLDDVDVVALDDIDRVAGAPQWESALFTVFDARLQRGGLLAAGASAPRDCGFGLADLVSRAGSCASYRLAFLNDADLQSALIGHAGRRGLNLEPAKAVYLLQRVSRDLGELTGCLDRIDRYSLAAQRRITIPLLREVLDL
jgi:DnaA family protein